MINKKEIAKTITKLANELTDSEINYKVTPIEVLNCIDGVLIDEEKACEIKELFSK